MDSGSARQDLQRPGQCGKAGEQGEFLPWLLLGILAYKADWIVYSNYETGDGYGDILVKIEDWKGNESLGIVIEVTYVLEGSLDSGTREALRQIEERHYADGLYDEGMEKVFRYGIAFRKKQCRVALGECRVAQQAARRRATVCTTGCATVCTTGCTQAAQRVEQQAARRLHAWPRMMKKRLHFPQTVLY